MTDKDKKLIYKWCGFKFLTKVPRDKLGQLPAFKYPNGCVHTILPILDLNFYFKYAVPKLWDLNYSIYYHIGKTLTTCLLEPYHYEVSKCFQAQDKDPAEAFGQALLKLIGGSNANNKSTTK